MAECIGAKKSLANRIKVNRVKMGWSQAKLAELVGVNSASTIGNWEAGLATPDYDKLCFLADLFDVTTDYLLGRDMSVSKASKQDDISTRIDDPSNATMYECCDEIGQAAIDNCIRFHYDRCVSVPATNVKGSSASKHHEKLFINRNDAEYDLMCQQMEYLKVLRKNSKKGYMDITKHLWECGYGDDICLAFVLDMFGPGVNKRVPSRKLYDDIEAFLKGNYAVVSNVKKI